MSSKIKITRVCQFCQNEFTARTTKTQYCLLKCSSRAYKARTRQSKIAESNRRTEIARNPNLETVKIKDFISVDQASILFGISRRTIYRIISRGELDIAKFGTRTVIRRSDMDRFFSIPLDQSLLRPVKEFPGLDQCYTIMSISTRNL